MEELIKYETAKLARACKMDEPCKDYWCEGVLNETTSYMQNSSSWDSAFSAFPQSWVQKWLRDTHKIYVGVILIGNSIHQSYVPYLILKLNPNLTTSYNDSPTYEEALEAGLWEALSKLKETL